MDADHSTPSSANKNTNALEFPQDANIDISTTTRRHDHGPSKIVRISDFCNRSTASRRQRRGHDRHGNGTGRPEVAGPSGTNLRSLHRALQGDHSDHGNDRSQSSVDFAFGESSLLSLDRSKLDNTLFSSRRNDVSAEIYDDGRDVLDTPISGSKRVEDVDVIVLKSIPSFDDPQTISDEFATVYTDDIQLLLTLQVFNGQICVMSKPASNVRCDKVVPWIPVILKVVSPDVMAALSEQNTLSQSQLRSQSDFSRAKYRVYVPPTIAFSIGLNGYGCLSMKVDARIACIPNSNDIMKYVHSQSQSSQTSRSVQRNASEVLDVPDAIATTLPRAIKANIEEISRPPDDIMPSVEDLFMSQDKVTMRRNAEDQKSAQIDRLQQYFYRRCGTDASSSHGGEKKRSAWRLMTTGSIFAVVEDCNPVDTFSMKIRSCIRFYRVAEIETEIGGAWDRANGGSCWVSPETQLVLLSKETKSFAHVHMSRMTQISSTFTFDRSVQCSPALKSSSNKPYLYSSFVRKAYSHPNVVNVTQSIMSAGSLISTLSRENTGTHSSLENHLLHLIGNEDDHIKYCLDTVADSGEYLQILDCYENRTFTFADSFHN